MAQTLEPGILIRDVDASQIMTKTSLPVGYSVNPMWAAPTAPILLCLVYETVHRPYGALGDLSGGRALPRSRAIRSSWITATTRKSVVPTIQERETAEPPAACLRRAHRGSPFFARTEIPFAQTAGSPETPLTDPETPCMMGA